MYKSGENIHCSVEEEPTELPAFTEAHYNVFDGICAIINMNPNYPITANVVAGFADTNGECTPESRLLAEQILRDLEGYGLVIKSEEPHTIGGDYHDKYELVINESLPEAA